MMELVQVNAMPANGFVAAFGDVAEHSPWVARCAAAARPFATRDAMVQAFTGAVTAAPRQKQLALLRAHPELAANARLTDDSAREQSSARLNTLAPREFADFARLNKLYKSRFGFPFILAVKGAAKQQILDSVMERLQSPPEDEFAMAVAQVCRILRFRIEDRVSA